MDKRKAAAVFAGITAVGGAIALTSIFTGPDAVEPQPSATAPVSPPPAPAPQEKKPSAFMDGREALLIPVTAETKDHIKVSFNIRARVEPEALSWSRRSAVTDDIAKTALTTAAQNVISEYTLLELDAGRGINKTIREMSPHKSTPLTLALRPSKDFGKTVGRKADATLGDEMWLNKIIEGRRVEPFTVELIGAEIKTQHEFARGTIRKIATKRAKVEPYQYL